LKDIEKSQGTCNGGPQYGKVITIAENYTACIKQPTNCLTWALIAALNYIGLSVNTQNAFAKSHHHLKTPSTCRLTPNFENAGWNALGIHPIHEGYIIPILKNLQGHPEEPHIWDIHIHGLGFSHTMH
jgi:hypothetical protein